MKNHLSIAALIGLAACGASNTPQSATLSPAFDTIENGPAILGGAVQSGLSTGDQADVTSNGIVINGVLYDLALSSPSFGAAHLPSGTTFAVVAFSDDGISGGQTTNIAVNVIGSSALSTAGFGQIAFYERVGTTLMPISGSAIYSGEYRATYGSQTTGINGSATGGLIAIVGDATIPIDFVTGISGAMITNRTSLLADGSKPDMFGDVTFADVTIDASGFFSGTATGGLNASQVLVLQAGQFEGMIGGLNGDSVAGALLLTSTDGANIFTEVGGFTAVRP